jgi:hypothetical protein
MNLWRGCLLPITAPSSKGGAVCPAQNEPIGGITEVLPLLLQVGRPGVRPLGAKEKGLEPPPAIGV